MGAVDDASCPIVPGPQPVCVRWLAPEAVPSEAWPQLAACLEASERERAARFHFAADRAAYIAAHALTRALLTQHAPRPAADWRFAAGPYGRPEIVRAAGDPPLRFNLSHNRGLVAVAVTHVCDIGIDVEAVDPARLTLDLAAHTFAPAEVALVRALPEASRTEAWFALWTLKEAYIKAVGRGLSLPLDSFAFALAPLAIRFSAACPDDPASWRFERLSPTRSHALALAVRHPNPASVRVEASEMPVSELLELCAQAGPGRISRK